MTQVLRFLLDEKASAEGLSVSACNPGATCDPPIATETTNESGMYSVEVPIRQSPVTEVGFRGFRLVHGEKGRLYPHRMHNSVPFLYDSYEETGIASEALTDAVLQSLGVEGGLNFVLLQVFDCRSTGAGGLYFEIDSPNARVEYLVEPGVWGPGPTLASAEAAAIALDLEPGRYHEIRAVTATRQVVALDRVYVPGDAVVLSSLHPRERE